MEKLLSEDFSEIDHISKMHLLVNKSDQTFNHYNYTVHTIPRWGDCHIVNANHGSRSSRFKVSHNRNELKILRLVGLLASNTLQDHLRNTLLANAVFWGKLRHQLPCLICAPMTWLSIVHRVKNLPLCHGLWQLGLVFTFTQRLSPKHHADIDQLSYNQSPLGQPTSIITQCLHQHHPHLHHIISLLEDVGGIDRAFNLRPHCPCLWRVWIWSQTTVQQAIKRAQALTIRPE